MKLRMTVIEADGVGTEDVADVLSKLFGSPLQVEPTPAVPHPALQPVQYGRNGLPPATPTAVVRAGPGWRPKAKAGKREKVLTGEGSNPRPAVKKHYICGACGGDLPADLDRRCSCPKCNSKRWEEVPARPGGAPGEEEA